MQRWKELGPAEDVRNSPKVHFNNCTSELGSHPALPSLRPSASKGGRAILTEFSLTFMHWLTMATPADLPDEIVLYMLETFIDEQLDRVHLLVTCRRLHNVILPVLYHYPIALSYNAAKQLYALLSDR
jgi:hypothetical protein